MKMIPKNKGLTVGELTMAIGGLILISLIWSSFKNKEKSSMETIEPIKELTYFKMNTSAKFNIFS